MTTPSVKTYAADLVALSIAGQTINSGYADGEFVSIEPTSPIYNQKVGTDGEVARSATNDRTATIKIKLLQTSLGNDTLQALVTLGRSANGADVGTFALTDLSGGMICRADKCWVSKQPTITRARDIVEYEWTLMAADMDMDPSGNAPI